MKVLSDSMSLFRAGECLGMKSLEGGTLTRFSKRGSCFVKFDIPLPYTV